MYYFWIIFGIMIGIAVGNDAQKKGMNGIVWGIFSAIFPIVALFYLLFGEAKVSAVNEPGTDPSDSKT
jgi:hypothetical protein